jgi:hypothetical protein
MNVSFDSNNADKENDYIKAKKHIDEEVLYVFSVLQAEQYQSNIHLRSDSNNLGADKNTLLRTHCEKHVNPDDITLSKVLE